MSASSQTPSNTLASQWPYPEWPLAKQPANTPFIVLAGPCVLEGEDAAPNWEAARFLAQLMAQYGPKVDFYFKSSFDKANRTSASGYRGQGLQAGLDVLKRIKGELGVKLVTDVHTAEQATLAAEVVDCLQIPAFLCRQTDLLLAAGETGKQINVKKGQFLSPPEVAFCVEKVYSTGNRNVWVCERGTTFGYNNLVVDMRAFPTVQGLGYPILLDATHSVQQPGALNGSSGGNRELAPHLARAAVAAGCSGLFFETHPNPSQALSDGPNQMPLHWVEPLLNDCLALRAALQSPS